MRGGTGEQVRAQRMRGRVCGCETQSEDKSGSEERKKWERDDPFRGHDSAADRNRAIISQPVEQKGTIILAPISAAAVVPSIYVPSGVNTARTHWPAVRGCTLLTTSTTIISLKIHLLETQFVTWSIFLKVNDLCTLEI